MDEDGDGKGEFGGLAELMGRVAERGGPSPKPILAARPFERGRVLRRGYAYRMYLPRRGGGLIAERIEGGFAKGEVDPDRAEKEWCLYAWPIEEENAGQRTFFASSDGDILATGWYEGPDESIAGGYAAAYEPAPHAAEGPDWKVATSGTGRDGRFWRMTG